MLAFVLVLATLAAVFDARSGRIPNWLTLGALGCVPIARALLQGAEAVVDSGVGALGAGAIPACVFFATRGRAIGGGDVKLLAALGALLGTFDTLLVTLTGLLAAALFALWQRSSDVRLGPGLALGTWLFSLARWASGLA